MVPFRYELFLDEFLPLVESGEISMARIDDAVERILRVKFISGVFEYPLADRSLLDIVGCKVFSTLYSAYSRVFHIKRHKKIRKGHFTSSFIQFGLYPYSMESLHFSTP